MLIPIPLLAFRALPGTATPPRHAQDKRTLEGFLRAKPFLQPAALLARIHQALKTRPGRRHVQFQIVQQRRHPRKALRRVAGERNASRGCSCCQEPACRARDAVLASKPGRQHARTPAPVCPPSYPRQTLLIWLEETVQDSARLASSPA